MLSKETLGRQRAVQKCSIVAMLMPKAASWLYFRDSQLSAACVRISSTTIACPTSFCDTQRCNGMSFKKFLCTTRSSTYRDRNAPAASKTPKQMPFGDNFAKWNRFTLLSRPGNKRRAFACVSLSYEDADAGHDGMWMLPSTSQ